MKMRDSPPYSPYPHSPYIRRISPPGSPADHFKKCCNEPDTPHHRQTMNEASFFCCCYTCPKRSSTSVLATMAVCCLVLGYTILGAFVFMALEGGFNYGETAVAASKSHSAPGTTENNVVLTSGNGLSTISFQTAPGETKSGALRKSMDSKQIVSNKNSENEPDREIGDLRSHTVDRLWSITENLNILYRENWTRLAAEEVLEFQEALFRALRNGNKYINDGHFVHHQNQHRWTFSSSFLYSLTLITTIGYGSVSPRTSWGKLVTIIYALIGIPLMLLYLSTTGDVLARSFRRLYGKLFGRSAAPCSNNPTFSTSKKPQCPCNTRVKVPVTLCLIIVLLYICSGALLFQRLENWSLLEGCYFCFTSLGTIGFGDLRPGQHTEEISLCACSAYILTGMALVAMCFSLVQDELLSLLRLLGATCSRTTNLKDEELSIAS